MNTNQQLESFIKEYRLLSQKHILEIIPISRQSWENGVKTKRYPQPKRFGPKLKFWLEKDISAFIDAC